MLIVDIVFWFVYIPGLESWSAFVWSIILVLLCQHDFSDAWTCFGICSLRLCIGFFHCIIIEHIPECLVWWHSVPYLGYYFTLWHNPILKFIRCFVDFSHYSVHFLVFASRHIGATPHSHLRLGHPPTVISFGASPHCHLRLGHPPTVISFMASPTVVYVWGIPPLSFTFGASPHSHFFWGIPPLSFRLGHPPIFILFRVFPYRQFA